MKKLFFLFAMCAALTFVSCKKDKEDEVLEAFMTANIDGAAFEASSITSIINGYFGDDILFSIGANADESFSIGLNIPTDTEINTTQAIDEFDFAITFTDLAENAYYTVGEIELTKIDTIDQVMEGNFNFTATDEYDATNVHQITDGEFRFTY